VTQLQQLTAAVAISACWGAFALVWVIGALYNASKGPTKRRRATPRSFVAAVIVVLVIVLATVRSVPARDWRVLQANAPWVSFLGLAILLASTAFAIWARVALGSMWSMNAVVKEGHQLRTDGPYGITRHPIYTGMLGMLLGSLLLAGVGQSIVLLPVGVVLFELKIRLEERLMSATFPDEYSGYRRRVPQLIPGLGRLHRDGAKHV
jgi:protein-S-isoprenylcysteine O-methyltransferase Ste14